MLQPFLLSVALALGQTEPPDAETPPVAYAAGSPYTMTAPAAPERWLLMKSLQGTWPGWLLDSHRINVSGWTDLSFTASSAAHEQLPMGFNYRANEFLLQQNWLRLDCPVVTSGTEPSVGFRSDTILPGSDYFFTESRGIFSSQLTANDGQPNTYGFDPVQFYAEWYCPTVAQGLDIKVGRIFCQFGVEVIDAPGNALLSHAYTFIYNPFTHTGMMATLTLNDTWTAQAGIMLGNDVFIDPASEPYGMGTIRWTSPDKRDSALFSVILGSGRFNQAEAFHNPEIFDLVYSHRINPRLNYNLEGLYGFTTNVPATGFANWFSILNYLTYDFTARVSGTTRLELFDDFQGQRTGFAGLYTVLTAGLAFKPWKSVIVRPELRFDYNGESQPFENQHGLFTAASDVILRW